MLILTKSVLSIMIAFILSVCFGIIILPILRKLKANQRLSVYLEEEHKEKKGTPTMGGFIFIIPSIISLLLLYIFNKI